MSKLHLPLSTQEAPVVVPFTPSAPKRQEHYIIPNEDPNCVVDGEDGLLGQGHPHITPKQMVQVNAQTNSCLVTLSSCQD
jgi:hypothetical protein